MQQSETQSSNCHLFSFCSFLFSKSLHGVTLFLVILRYARETTPYPSCAPMLPFKRDIHRKDAGLCSHRPGATECKAIQKPSPPDIVRPCTQWL